MKGFFALVSAAFVAAGLLLSPSRAEAAFFPGSGLPEMATQPLVLAQANCRWVKEDPRCWGDTCRVKKVCSPAGPYRPGLPSARPWDQIALRCTPCRGGRQRCQCRPGSPQQCIRSCQR